MLYSHKKTLVYMLTQRPPGWTCRKYLERGWPTFERRVTMLLKMQSSRAWANVVHVGNPAAKMLAPLTPRCAPLPRSAAIWRSAAICG